MSQHEAAQTTADPEVPGKDIAYPAIENERLRAALNLRSNAEKIRQQLLKCRAQGLPCIDSPICPCFDGTSFVQKPK